jgi:hypothetical protein
MPALIIGDEQRAMIGSLRARMAANPIDPAEAMAQAKADPAAYRRRMGAFTIELPVGYVVTYSVERQPEAPPPGLCAHISISVTRARLMPSIEAVDMILAEFGMAAVQSGKSKIWVETIDERTKAVNVIQLLT